MKTFSEKNYKDVVNADKVSLVFFTSSGCHLCVKLKPIIKKLEKQYSSIGFYTCDIDKEKKLTKVLLKDEGVPTGFVMKSGAVFKVKDPEIPDDKSWYSEKYLTEIIEALQ
jgi:thiol-disulfide isomerase/thioredoxin